MEVATTSFDVAEHWSHAPRYGFFADFAPDEDPSETESRADFMNALHLNVVQFYDWMYSHHTLVPPTDEFIDPLGRLLSLDVVLRNSNFPGVVCPDHFDHALHLLLDAGFEAIDFDEKHCLSILRNSGRINARLDRLNGLAVDHLQGRGHDASRDDSGHCARRIRHRIIDSQHRFHRRWGVEQSHCSFGDGAKGSF